LSVVAGRSSSPAVPTGTIDFPQTRTGQLPTLSEMPNGKPAVLIYSLLTQYDAKIVVAEFIY
ncbi:hypothetical protein BaRGS_00030498, partial [Batillaria attramentaria]